MFNDKYGLTEAVLNGRKTQTRRIAGPLLCYTLNLTAIADKEEIINLSRYKIGEVVAIAQRYSEINVPVELSGYLKGWNNKMFVRADRMPHHIKITDVRIERLQDISDADCIAEGIEACGYDYEGREIYSFKYGDGWHNRYRTEKEAYASLIDKVGKKGTWDSNPWVFVYCFELVD